MKYACALCLLLASWLGVGCARVVIRSPFEAIVSRYNEAHSSVFCEIESDDFTANGVCVTLKNIVTNENLVSNSCMETTSVISSFELQNVPVGEYEISIEIIERVEHVVLGHASKIFSIYYHNDIIPLVQFSPDGDTRHHRRGSDLNRSLVELQFVADHATGVSTVSVPYRIVPRFPVSLASPLAQLPAATAAVLANVRAAFLSEFNICVDIFDSSLGRSTTTAGLHPFASVCSALVPGSDSMDIFNMPVGSYNINIFVQHKQFADDGVRYYEEDGPELRLAVSSLHERALVSPTESKAHLHPDIVVRGGARKEYGFDKSRTSGAIVAFEFGLDGYVGAVSQVQTCMTAFRVEEGRGKEPIVEFTCLAVEQRTVTLSPIPEGDYEVLLQLRMTAAPFTVFETVTTLAAAVRPMVELVPTYEWQRLHAWHTIPTGIITRLPVGGAAHKEARIAEPWTLQLLLPKPKSKRRLRKPKVVMVDGHDGPRRMQPMECVAKSSFLRFPVSRSTSTSEIIEAACKACNIDYASAASHVPPELHGCVYLTAAAAAGESGETSRIVLTEDRRTTAESVDLFNLNHRMLHVNESCLVPATEPEPEAAPEPEPEPVNGDAQGGSAV